MTEQRQPMSGLPAEVVQEDRQLEASVESASEELARLRWRWTLDEDNAWAVSFRAYARAVGKDEKLIREYAHTHVRMASSAGRGLTFAEARSQAIMSAERHAMAAAVAEAHETSTEAVRSGRYRSELGEVRNAVADEHEKREQRGESFDAKERAEYARRVAVQKKTLREAEERHLREQRQKHNAMFLEVDARLSKARRELKEALDSIRDVEFSEEEVELLERQNDAVKGMARLVGSALTGDSGTDWDAELAALEEKRQYG